MTTTKWNVPQEAVPNVERLLGIASANAYSNASDLEAFALFVAGAGAPGEWRDKVRGAAAHLISTMADLNVTTKEALSAIGRALSLVQD